MTLNGVGSRTRLGLPEGRPRCEPLSRAHRCSPTERGAALQPRSTPDGRVRHDLRLHRSRRPQSAALRMMPRALLPRLLLAVSAAAAGAPGTALPPTAGDATLAIVFDVTGSMWDDLMQVMDGASRILERSLSHHSRAIANYALVPFHDPGSAPRPRVRVWRPVAALSHPPSARDCSPGAPGRPGAARAGAPSQPGALPDLGHLRQALQPPFLSPGTCRARPAPSLL